MYLIIDNKKDHIDKTQTEIVQKKKHEYKIFGTFLRTKGLNLFYYNSSKNETVKCDIKYSETIHLVYRDSRFIAVDYEQEKCFSSSSFIYFEALNMNTAIKRVAKFKAGIINDLSNLRIPNKEGIKFY